MTVFEHAMLGTSLALSTGLYRRQGLSFVAMAAFTSALPDWDGLSILPGGEAYASAHRVWGHNLLVASLLGGLAGTAGYCFSFARFWRQAVARLPRLLPSMAAWSPVRPFSCGQLVLWQMTGIMASLSHLAVDLVYSSGPGLSVWPLQLLWPFSPRGWAFPLVPWGDLGATVIFILEMFLLYYWPRCAQWIAVGTLMGVLAYIGAWWLLHPAP